MPARFCSQCGREVPSSGRFCSHCAAPLPGPGEAPPGVTDTTQRLDAASSGLRRLIPALIAAALIVLTVTVAVLAGRLHHASLLTARTSAPSAPPLISAPSQPVVAPPLLGAPSQPVAAAPVTNTPSQPPAGLPPDVDAYLKFLKGIEDRRVALANDTSGAMAMMQVARSMQSDQNDPEQHDANVQGNVKKISGGFDDYNTKWQILVRDFRAQPPPDACSDLANHYWTFLTGYAKVISGLQVALLNGDIGQAMGAQGAQAQINAAALDADGALAKLCQRYNAPKPFSIQPDGAGSALLGQ